MIYNVFEIKIRVTEDAINIYETSDKPNKTIIRTDGDIQTMKDAAVRAISFYFEKEISKLFEQCQNSTP